MKRPEGIIILLHNGFAKISVDEVLKVLPLDLLKLPRHVKEINYSELLDLSKLYSVSYEQYALEHRRLFASEIAPLLSVNPSYRILYFGLAPLPLCIDLGHLFYNYRDIEVYQKHHVTKEWFLELHEGSATNEFSIIGLPEHEQKGISEALVRMGISHPINVDDTNEILSNAAEVDIKVASTGEDVIDSKPKMVEVGELVKKAFDVISSNRSSLERIHLFAAVTCGVAFQIGTKISPNNHPYIQTYQFSRTKSPKYVKALLIKSQLNPERKKSKKEKSNAKELREVCNQILLTDIRKYCELNRGMSSYRSWFQGIIPSLKPGIMDESFWKNLPAICETSLPEDTVDFKLTDINDGFYWRTNRWYIDDNFFIALSKRLKSTDDIKMALRLFLFHEAVHYKKHKVTEATSQNIGSFPKVLETADYQADVYAILNEYGYCNSMIGAVQNAREFFLKCIQIAVETMWSFDDNGVNLEQIQIRRLNRYLIWYWQYAMIEKSANSLDEIVSILTQKPVLELNGLKTKEENNRFFFILEKRRDQPLELGSFYNNELIRDGSATNMPLEALVDGVKTMKGDLILNAMRSFVSR